MAVIVLPALDDLVTTGYGLALLTKVGAVVPVIASVPTTVDGWCR